jgi:hypothetical protein
MLCRSGLDFVAKSWRVPAWLVAGSDPVRELHDTLWNEHFGVPVPGSSLI